VLRVEGLVDKPLSLSIEELGRMPPDVEARDHDDTLARFEGVTLTEVLKAAGAPLGERLRHPSAFWSKRRTATERCSPFRN
jgi:DMSO/TMAO reductase YedYZ molybdopterin-dependent catalytic subunit